MFTKVAKFVHNLCDFSGWEEARRAACARSAAAAYRATTSAARSTPMEESSIRS